MPSQSKIEIMLCRPDATFFLSQSLAIDDSPKIQEMPPMTAFLVGLVNTKSSLINNMIEEIVDILERGDMKGATDSATLLTLAGVLAKDSSSKASKYVVSYIGNLKKSGAHIIT